MTLLAVDTSGRSGSIALATLDGAVIKSLKQTRWMKKAMHSEVATLQLQQLLSDCAMDLRALTHLAVNIGPGSFTGIRVGVSLVKTLAYALALPVAALNSLENLAYRQSQVGEKIFIATKAVQSFYYAGAFERTPIGLTPLLEPLSLDEHELAAHSKDCTKVWIEGRSEGFSPETEAQDLILYLAGSMTNRIFLDWKSVEPLYIRASEAEEKLKKRLLKPV